MHGDTHIINHSILVYHQDFPKEVPNQESWSDYCTCNSSLWLELHVQDIQVLHNKMFLYFSFPSFLDATLCMCIKLTIYN